MSEEEKGNQGTGHESLIGCLGLLVIGALTGKCIELTGLDSGAKRDAQESRCAVTRRCMNNVGPAPPGALVNGHGMVGCLDSAGWSNFDEYTRSCP